MASNDSLEISSAQCYCPGTFWEPVCQLVTWPSAHLDLQVIDADANVEVRGLPVADVCHDRLAPSTTSWREDS